MGKKIKKINISGRNLSPPFTLTDEKVIAKTYEKVNKYMGYKKSNKKIKEVPGY
jgi:hypothetical protein